MGDFRAGEGEGGAAAAGRECTRVGWRQEVAGNERLVSGIVHSRGLVVARSMHTGDHGRARGYLPWKRAPV